MTLPSAVLARLLIIAATTGLMSSGLFLGSVLMTDLSALDRSAITTEQHTWQSANAECQNLGDDWQLPSIVELTAIYYLSSTNPLLENTDYWSRNAIAGFAFGLNTHRGIASLDRYNDTDHFICVRMH
jgi:hypothetical protein